MNINNPNIEKNILLKKQDELKNKIQKDILLSFIFDDKKDVRQVIKHIKQHLSSINISEEENKKYYRIIYQILVELIENICKHSQLSVSRKSGFYIIENKDNLVLKTIGFCEYEDFCKLLKMYELNELSRENLKEKFLKEMNNGKKLSDRGGAGLGYLRIVRLIKKHFPEIQKIFEIEEIQKKDNLIKFNISIKVPKQKNE